MVTATRLQISGIDFAVIVLFLLAILALGFSAKLKKASILQFLVAGRHLTLPLFIATLVSTWYGGILGVGESVSYFGLGTLVLMGVPYYVFGILYALFLAKPVRDAEQISIPERLERKFGRAPALIGGLLVFLLAVPAAHVLMLGVLIELLTGWNALSSLVAATLVGTIFLYRGGMLADVRVSMLAFVMMYIGFGTIVGFCLLNFPFLQTLDSLQNRSLLTWDGGTGWVYVVSFFILGAWTLIDPGFHQRAASAETPQIAKNGILIAVVCWFVFDLLTITTGMYAMALLQSTHDQPLAIFPLFGEAVLPQGLKAVFLCGMIGTILSAMVGYALVGGATFGRDIVCRIYRISADAAATHWSRIGIGVGSVLAILLALRIPSVVNLWYQWGGIVTGSILLPVLLAYEVFPRWKPRMTAILWSMIASFGLSVAWLVYSQQSGNPLLEVAMLPEGWVLPRNDHEPSLMERIAMSQKWSVGTLLPALLVSLTILTFGTIGAKRERNSQIHGTR